ncbi:MAG: hypothetical protein IPL25_03560 [Saprospiraceae bacterium]|nr:hypothetical protein [Candidatus Vicinibacter affinis]
MKKLLAYMILLHLLLFTACNKENISNEIFNQDKPINALATAADNCATDGLIENNHYLWCGKKILYSVTCRVSSDSTYPLVFAFHGKGSGHKNKACAWKERIGEWVDENKFIGVYGRAYLDSFWYVHGVACSHYDAGSISVGSISIRRSSSPALLPDSWVVGWNHSIPWRNIILLRFCGCLRSMPDWATHNLCTTTGIGTSFLIDTYVINKTSWCSPPVMPVLPVSCKKCKKETIHYQLEGIGHTIYDQIAPIPGYKERINDDIFKFFKRHRL